MSTTKAASGLVASSKSCTVCSRSTIPTEERSVKVLANFLKLWTRFVNSTNISSELQNVLNSQKIPLVICKSCVALVSEFCNLYHQLKAIELQLNWNLTRIVNLVEQSHDLNGVSHKDVSRVFRDFIAEKSLPKLENCPPRVKLQPVEYAPIRVDSSAVKQEDASDVPEDAFDSDANNHDARNASSAQTNPPSPPVSPVPSNNCSDSEDYVPRVKVEARSSKKTVTQNSGNTDRDGEDDTSVKDARNQDSTVNGSDTHSYPPSPRSPLVSSSNYSSSSESEDYVPRVNKKKVHRPRKIGTTTAEKTDLNLFCKLCNRSFIKQRFHFMNHQVLKHHTCPFPDCSVVLKDLEEFQEHSLSCHSVRIDIFPCEHCGDWFPNREKARGHNAFHTIVTCPICKKKLTRRKLKTHTVAEHNKCFVGKCGFTGGTLLELQGHQVAAHGKEVDVFKCTECDKLIMTKKDCRRHIRSHKSRKIGESYKCEDCGQVFTSCIVWGKHRSVSHADKALFKCEICGKGIPRANKLRIHLVNDHHKCSVGECNLFTESRTELWDHQVKVHGKEVDVFKCPDCKLMFTRPSNMKKHQDVHKNKKLGITVKCRVCGKRFPTDSNLRSHMYNKHPKSNLVDVNKEVILGI